MERCCKAIGDKCVRAWVGTNVHVCDPARCIVDIIKSP